MVREVKFFCVLPSTVRSRRHSVDERVGLVSRLFPAPCDRRLRQAILELFDELDAHFDDLPATLVAWTVVVAIGLLSA